MPVAQYPTNLAQIMSGGSIAAADMANQQFQSAQQADQMNQQQALQDYLFQQQKQPGELQQQQANIGRTNAETGLTKSQTTGVDLANQLKQATQSSDIMAAIEKNKTALTEDKVKQYAALGQQASQLADYLQQGGTIPLDAQLPDEIKTLAAKGPQALREWGNNIAIHSADQLRTIQQEKQRGENSANVARINAEGRLQAAMARANAGHRGADDVIEKSLASGSWDRVAAAYDRKAQLSLEQGDQDSAQYYQQKSKEYADKYAATRAQPSGITPTVGAGGEISITNKQPTPTALPALPGGAKKDAQGRIHLD